ncbi:MAG: glutamate-5-semialdehyde dehydrogenase [Anaerolineales bacterium]|nr:glutamate-5-semialdehyde dehydrogenase [Anaerolineales bacterium]
MNNLTEMGRQAKKTSRILATLNTNQKDAALRAIAGEIEAQAKIILAENAKDIAAGREKGHSETLLDRLLLTEQRVAALAADTRRVAELPDPVGSEIESRLLPNGMRLSRRRIPIGVLGVIYEARPNVTIDIAALALKTGNAAILRGGSETLRSNLALVKALQAALEKSGLPRSAVQYIDNPDRGLVGELLRLDKYVDMIIPRGGASLQRLCQEEGTIPVITGGIGICHIFVDQSADLQRAPDIIENSKVQRPSVCNALDTLLVHRAIAAEFLPQVAERLAQSNVELRATLEATKILETGGHSAKIVPAETDDFDQEWLGLILGIKVVDGIDEAIAHIHAHSTEHTDSILTSDWANATRFVEEINSAAVFVNASTRFNDGGQFGLGAEVAVSTQKLHARGPMGLEALTTYKWIGIGDGNIRE